MEYNGIFNEESIRRFLKLVDQGLSHGRGEGEPGFVCIEAAVCLTFENRNDDDPECVDPALRDLKIRLNDCNKWTTNLDRAAGLRRLGVAQLGTRDNFDSEIFLKNLAVCVYNLALKRTSLKYPAAENWEAFSSTHANNVIKEMGLEYLAWAITSIKDRRFATGSMRLASVIKEISRNSNELAEACEGIVQILVKMETPGVEFLYLTEQPGGPQHDQEIEAQTI